MQKEQAQKNEGRSSFGNFYETIRIYIDQYSCLCKCPLKDDNVSNIILFFMKQLGGLLDSAQALLADAMPSAMMATQASTIKNANGTTPAVYSCLAMQVHMTSFVTFLSLIVTFNVILRRFTTLLVTFQDVLGRFRTFYDVLRRFTMLLRRFFDE